LPFVDARGMPVDSNSAWAAGARPLKHPKSNACPSHLCSHVVYRQFRPLLFVVAVTCVYAQQTAPSTTAKPDPKASAADGLGSSMATSDKRAFGIVPNYRSTNAGAAFQPIGTKQKIGIAARDSFDWSVFLIAGGYAGLGQMTNQNPSFHQGTAGYANRYARIYLDIIIGNFLTEGFLPSLLHEDPRYFRLGHGTFWHRLGYATSRSLVTRTDSGGNRFSFSEVLGDSISAGISNAYYPDNRNAGDNFRKLAFQLGTDAVGDVLKEFWPDVKARISKRRQNNKSWSGPGVWSPQFRRAVNQ